MTLETGASLPWALKVGKALPGCAICFVRLDDSTDVSVSLGSQIEWFKF